MYRLLGSLTVLGRPGFWLGLAIGVLLFVVIVPTSLRQLWWLLESERIVEEMADPVLLDFIGPNEPPFPRETWEAGRTMYVQREVCIWKIVPGQIEREIVDTARLPLEVTPLGTMIYREGKDYEPDGKVKPPPWCGKRISPATIPAFMAPSPVILRARIDAALNPAKPHVWVQLRPIPFTINTTPVQSGIRESVRLTQQVQNELDRKYGLLRLQIDLLAERVRELDLLKAQYAQLYRYLQAERILPATPPVIIKPKPGGGNDGGAR